MDDKLSPQFRRPPVPTAFKVEDKEQERERIARDTRIFLALGGEIDKKEKGESAEVGLTLKKHTYNTIKMDGFDPSKAGDYGASVKGGASKGASAMAFKAAFEKTKRPYQYHD